MSEPKLISTWEELKAVSEESETHYLKVDKNAGWIIPRYPKDENSFEGRYYLSTHTFYGHKHKESTEILQKCGFNVKLTSWD